MYKYGYGVKQDYAEALKWLNISAEAGYPTGQFNLADMYIAGHGVDRNYGRAAELYLAAARQGHSEAQYNIGEMYAAGYGVQQSFVLGYAWADISSQTSDVFHRSRANRNRDAMAAQMTPEQIEEAKALASRCLESAYRDCTP